MPFVTVTENKLVDGFFENNVLAECFKILKN